MVSKFTQYIPVLFVTLVASGIFLIGLGKNTLADWDEAWYADASRTMFRSGHFLTPIWNNQYFFDKPPLQYWLTQPFLWIFGETEFSYRLLPAMASVGLIIITYLWAKERQGIMGGIMAAAILLSFPHFIDRGRSGNFDGLFIFLTTLSLFLFVKKKPVLGGIFLGLSWLTKGIFSGLFPIVVFCLLLLIWKFTKLPDKSHSETSGSFVNFYLKALVLYLILGIFVYFPWHILQSVRFHDVISQSYFSTLDQETFGDWSWTSIVWRFDLRYIVFLWTFLRWWFPLLFVSLVCQFVKFDRIVHTTQNKDVWQFADRCLPFAVFTTVFVALSTALQKNDWYIMPTYPFIALMIVDKVDVIARSLRRGNLFFMARLPRSLYSLAMTQNTASTFFIIFSISISNLLSHWQQAFPPDQWFPERQIGEYIASHTSSDALVVTAEYEFPTLRYYSERDVRTAAPQQDLQGKYWWVWDAADMTTALTQGRQIIVIYRPGTEWSIDVTGYERKKIGEINGRIISKLVLLAQ